MDKPYDSLSIEEKLGMRVHRDTRAISEEAAHQMGLEVTRAAQDILSELAHLKLKAYARDLELFAKHAKRNTVTADDIKLLLRNNPSLQARICSLADGQSPSKAVKRKKTKPEPVPSTSSAGEQLVTASTSNEKIQKDQTTAMDEDEDMFADIVDLTL